MYGRYIAAIYKRFPIDTIAGRSRKDRPNPIPHGKRSCSEVPVPVYRLKQNIFRISCIVSFRMQRQGKGYGKCRAFALFTGNSNIPAMQIDDPLCQRKPQAVSLGGT